MTEELNKENDVVELKFEYIYKCLYKAMKNTGIHKLWDRDITNPIYSILRSIDRSLTECDEFKNVVLDVNWENNWVIDRLSTRYFINVRGEFYTLPGDIDRIAISVVKDDGKPWDIPDRLEGFLTTVLEYQLKYNSGEL